MLTIIKKRRPASLPSGMSKSLDGLKVATFGSTRVGLGPMQSAGQPDKERRNGDIFERIERRLLYRSGHRRPAAEMNGPANRPRDAVANTGPHRALVLAVISTVVVATTAFLLRCTHPPPSQQRRHPFGRAPANSMRLVVSRGFAFSMAETTIVTRD
jgi:hypothetical protein